MNIIDLTGMINTRYQENIQEVVEQNMLDVDTKYLMFNNYTAYLFVVIDNAIEATVTFSHRGRENEVSIMIDNNFETFTLMYDLFVTNRLRTKGMTHRDSISDYKPIPNHINENSAYNGWMFETYGNELNFVKMCQSNHVWSIVELDTPCMDNTIFVSGFRHPPVIS